MHPCSLIPYLSLFLLEIRMMDLQGPEAPRYTKAVDVWSLGVILYLMTYEVTPFQLGPGGVGGMGQPGILDPTIPSHPHGRSPPFDGNVVEDEFGPLRLRRHRRDGIPISYDLAYLIQGMLRVDPVCRATMGEIAGSLWMIAFQEEDFLPGTSSKPETGKVVYTLDRRWVPQSDALQSGVRKAHGASREGQSNGLDGQGITQPVQQEDGEEEAWGTLLRVHCVWPERARGPVHRERDLPQRIPLYDTCINVGRSLSR